MWLSDVISQVVLTSRLIKKEEEIAMAHKGRLCDGRGGGMSDLFHLSRQTTQLSRAKTPWHVSNGIQRSGDGTFFGSEERIILFFWVETLPSWSTGLCDQAVPAWPRGSEPRIPTSQHCITISVHERLMTIQVGIMQSVIEFRRKWNIQQRTKKIAPYLQVEV